MNHFSSYEVPQESAYPLFIIFSEIIRTASVNPNIVFCYQTERANHSPGRLVSMYRDDLLEQVYNASNRGLDIITELLPTVDDAVINHKKAFRLRPEERTPSAHLYPPKDSGDCWHVKDFGMGEGGGYFSPIDLYMWINGKSQFRMALEELTG